MGVDGAGGSYGPSDLETTKVIKSDDENLLAENKKLRKLLDTFITHSNGMSIWVRIPSYKEKLPKDLADDIQDLYDYQCHVEDEINKFGDQNDKDNSIH